MKVLIGKIASVFSFSEIHCSTLFKIVSSRIHFMLHVVYLYSEDCFRTETWMLQRNMLKSD